MNYGHLKYLHLFFMSVGAGLSGNFLVRMFVGWYSTASWIIVGCAVIAFLGAFGTQRLFVYLDTPRND